VLESKIQLIVTISIYGLKQLSLIVAVECFLNSESRIIRDPFRSIRKLEKSSLKTLNSLLCFYKIKVAKSHYSEKDAFLEVVLCLSTQVSKCLQTHITFC
jgi:hypothetical protein